MITRKRFDAAIIGAGPAGLMAARELSKDNLNYIILDAKNKIGRPLRCGEITREETFLELFKRTDYPFIKNKISNMSFQIKNTQTLVKKNMFMLDKPEFLQWLAEPIEANLMLNTKLLEIKKKDGLLELITTNGAFHAKLVVLANGTSYKFHKDFNLIKKNIELVPCIGGFFKNTTLNHDTAYFFYDEEMYIASWVFPKEGNIFNAGAGVILKNKITKGVNLRESFKKAMKKIELPLEGEPSFGGSYVANGPIGRTYSDNLLVCGDAAGQVSAVLGEGIYLSLKAGQLAGQTTIKALRNDTLSSQFLKSYEMDWKKSIGQKMNASVISATLLFFLMRHQLALKALKILHPEEIGDSFFNGKVSLRLKLFHLLLKCIGSSPKR